MQPLRTRSGEALAVVCLFFLALVPSLARADWNVQDSGVKDLLRAVHFVSPELGWAVGDASTILHTKNGGRTWLRQIPRDANGLKLNSVIFTSPKVGWTRSSMDIKKILHTTDGGATWQDFPIPDEAEGGGSLHTAVGSSYFVWTGSTLFRTDDGKDWVTTRGDFLSSGYKDYAVGMWFTDKDNGCFAQANGSVVTTANGGKTWQVQPMAHQLQMEFNDEMMPHFIDVKTGWVLSKGHSLIHATVDGGKTWKPQQMGPDAVRGRRNIQFISAKVGHVLTETEEGGMWAVQQTKDGGKTWRQLELQVHEYDGRYIQALSFPDAEHGWVVAEHGFIARYQVPMTEAPKGKGHRTAENLFADMPKDAYPKFGPAGGIERAAARKWLTEEFTAGQVVEWEATVTEVYDEGDGPFSVKLFVAVKGDKPISGWCLGKPISLGGQLCQVIMVGHIYGDELRKAVEYNNCTTNEVKLLRGLKGKKVAIRGTVEGASLGDGVFLVVDEKEDLVEREQIVIELQVPRLSVDGFLREASKAKDEK